MSSERKKFGQKWSLRSDSLSPSGSGPSGSEGGPGTARMKSDFELKGGANGILRVVMLKIHCADDLPRLANSAFFSFLFCHCSFQSLIFFFPQRLARDGT